MEALAGYTSDSSGSSCASAPLSSEEHGGQLAKTGLSSKSAGEKTGETNARKQKTENKTPPKPSSTKLTAAANSAPDTPASRNPPSAQVSAREPLSSKPNSEPKQVLSKRKRPFLARAQPFLPSKHQKGVSTTGSNNDPQGSRESQATVLEDISTEDLPAEFLRDAKRSGLDVADIIDYKPSEHLGTYTEQDLQRGAKMSVAYGRGKRAAEQAGPISRLQRQKHQITSVAATLAANKFQIEEKREQTQRSKAATWSKYGW